MAGLWSQHFEWLLGMSYNSMLWRKRCRSIEKRNGSFWQLLDRSLSWWECRGDRLCPLELSGWNKCRTHSLLPWAGSSLSACIFLWTTLSLQKAHVQLHCSSFLREFDYIVFWISCPHLNFSGLSLSLIGNQVSFWQFPLHLFILLFSAR